MVPAVGPDTYSHGAVIGHRTIKVTVGDLSSTGSMAVTNVPARDCETQKLRRRNIVSRDQQIPVPDGGEADMLVFRITTTI